MARPGPGRLGCKSHHRFKPRGGGKKFGSKKHKDQRDCEYVSNDNTETPQTNRSDLTNTPKKFCGGKLAESYEIWLEMTSDKWILKTMRVWNRIHSYSSTTKYSLTAKACQIRAKRFRYRNFTIHWFWYCGKIAFQISLTVSIQIHSHKTNVMVQNELLYI